MFFIVGATGVYLRCLLVTFALCPAEFTSSSSLPQSEGLVVVFSFLSSYLSFLSLSLPKHEWKNNQERKRGKRGWNTTRVCTWLRSKTVKKCSWLRRGLPRGGVIMVTLIAWPWKVDTFLIWYSKARAWPIYHAGIPTATPCLLVSFSTVYNTHDDTEMEIRRRDTSSQRTFIHRTIDFNTL